MTNSVAHQPRAATKEDLDDGQDSAEIDSRGECNGNMNTNSKAFQATAHAIAAFASLLLATWAWFKRHQMPEQFLYSGTDLMVSGIALFFVGLGVFNFVRVWRVLRPMR